MNKLITKKNYDYQLFTDAFPPEEFAERRMRIMEIIGLDSICVLQGAREYPTYIKFRQNNNFYDRTGVEVPRAMLLLDGYTKEEILFLAPKDERLELWDGPYLVPNDEATKLTGISKVISIRLSRVLRSSITRICRCPFS